MTWTIQPLFPKPLASSKINEEVCDILCDDVQDYEFTLDIEETGTEGGITTNKHVLHNKPALLDYFTRKVRECMCRLGYHCDIQITTSWYTVTFPGGYSAEHAHCNSWYSAVVYFADYDDDSSQIQFVNPPSGVYVHPADYTDYNCSDAKVSPERGNIILFPSDVRHKILVNHSKEDRFSMAFNILPKGYIDAGDSSYLYQ